MIKVDTMSILYNSLQESANTHYLTLLLLLPPRFNRIGIPRRLVVIGHDSDINHNRFLTLLNPLYSLFQSTLKSTAFLHLPPENLHAQAFRDLSNIRQSHIKPHSNPFVLHWSSSGICHSLLMD